MSTAPHVIDYQGSFKLPASDAQVWDALAEFDHYEAWWSWLTELRVNGLGLQPGTVLHGTVVPPLPYRMRLRLTFVECVPQRLLRATVDGDLHGSGQLVLETTGPETRAEVAWTMELSQRRLRLLARVARPLLVWAHDRIVELTVSRFREYLRSAGCAPELVRKALVTDLDRR